jgi:hypothetical protein
MLPASREFNHAALVSFRSNETVYEDKYSTMDSGVQLGKVAFRDTKLRWRMYYGKL